MYLCPRSGEYQHLNDRLARGYYSPGRVCHLSADIHLNAPNNSYGRMYLCPRLGGY